jgi:hypothetical protein
MKEGYLQIKIAELNDKCKNIDQMINMEKSKIILLQEQVGGFKVLLKKLRDLDEVKKQTISKINEENEKIMEKQIDILSKKISETFKQSFENKNKKINDFLNNININETEKKDKDEIFNKKLKEIEYLIEHNHLLMMKLANKGILSEREINEMDTRSNKKIKSMFK